MTFTYEALPMRVVFGAGSVREVFREAERLGLRRLLVLSTPGQRARAEDAATLLGEACAGLFTEARMHVPVEVAAAAREAASAAGADGCLAIGGGSTIGLGKAIALTSGLPVISVPTTYAGSEMTPVWGLTDNGRKQTGRDRAVLPRSVVYTELADAMHRGVQKIMLTNADIKATLDEVAAEVDRASTNYKKG